MARALSQKVIPLKDGTDALYAFLRQYHAEFNRDSSTERGHVYWSAPVGQWILVMKKGSNAQVTFHAADDCPCQMI
jgi:sarcosine oxidase gamma subunit